MCRVLKERRMGRRLGIGPSGRRVIVGLELTRPRWHDETIARCLSFGSMRRSFRTPFSGGKRTQGVALGWYALPLRGNGRSQGRCGIGVRTVRTRCVRGAYAVRTRCVRGADAARMRLGCGANEMGIRYGCDASFAWQLRGEHPSDSALQLGSNPDPIELLFPRLEYAWKYGEESYFCVSDVSG
jgi:hypothetical protein